MIFVRVEFAARGLRLNRDLHRGFDAFGTAARQMDVVETRRQPIGGAAARSDCGVRWSATAARRRWSSSSLRTLLAQHSRGRGPHSRRSRRRLRRAVASRRPESGTRRRRQRFRCCVRHGVNGHCTLSWVCVTRCSVRVRGRARRAGIVSVGVADRATLLRSQPSPLAPTPSFRFSNAAVKVARFGLRGGERIEIAPTLVQHRERLRERYRAVAVAQIAHSGWSPAATPDCCAR